MIRGTTPTLKFKLPFETSLLSRVYITFSQNGEVVIEKLTGDCECSENVLTVTLTQAETLLLSCICNVEIQIRGKTNDGVAVASQIITTKADRILKDGEI